MGFFAEDVIKTWTMILSICLCLSVFGLKKYSLALYRAFMRVLLGCLRTVLNILLERILICCSICCSYVLFGVRWLTCLYPYSTQATNCPNRHELIYFNWVGGGGREVSLIFFSNRDVLRVSPDSDTMSLRILGGGVGSIWLESRKSSLRLAK